MSTYTTDLDPEEDLGTVDTTKPTKPTKPKKAGKESKAKAKGGKANGRSEKSGADAAAVVTDALPDTNPERSRIPTWATVVGVVLAVGLIASTAFAVVQWRRASDAGSIKAGDRDRQAAAMTASRFVEGFSTWDYNNLDATKQNVSALLTDEYKPTFGKGWDEGYYPILSSAKLTATASVKTSLANVNGDTATAMVIVDQDVVTTAQRLKKIGTYFSIDLKKENGEWKVAAATLLGTKDQQVTDANGNPIPTSTTTTTIPVP